MSIMSDKLKALKVVKSSNITAPLETFISSLGIEKNPDIYLYNNTAYLDITPLLNILSVQLQWFIKNSESPLHYITIKKNVYANKYGLTKILAQSKEYVALKLQDYIYEVIYKLETKKTVSIDDLVSRKELQKTLQELDLYKSALSHKDTVVKETTDELSQIQTDYAIVNNEYEELKEKYNELLESNKELDNKYTKLQYLTKQIIAFNIKSNVITTKSKIFKKIESIIEDDIEDEYVDNSLINDLTNDSSSRSDQLDKKSINRTSSQSISSISQKSKKENVNTETIYIMYSTKYWYNDDDKVYQWTICNKLPKINIFINDKEFNDFKEFSACYKIGAINIDNPPENVLFQELSLPKQLSKLLAVLFDIYAYLTMSDVTRIIDMIHTLI